MSDPHALTYVWHEFLDKYDIQVVAAEPDDMSPAQPSTIDACPTCHDAHATTFATASCAYERASADLSQWATELDDAYAHESAMSADHMDAIDRLETAKRRHTAAVLYLHACLMDIKASVAQEAAA